MEEATAFVRRTLPKLTDSEVETVMKTLEELGLETIGDISRIKESELSNLKPLQIRRLIALAATASVRCECAACQPKPPAGAVRKAAETTATEGGDSSQTEVDEPSTACPGGYTYYYTYPTGYGGCPPMQGGG
jgi:hypothetical protein